MEYSTLSINPLRSLRLRKLLYIECDLAYQYTEASSTAEIVADLLIEWNIPITYESARALYFGIIGDTGRFMYSNTTEKTLLIASKLLSKGLNIQELHNEIYLDP